MIPPWLNMPSTGALDAGTLLRKSVLCYLLQLQVSALEMLKGYRNKGESSSRLKSKK